MREKKKHIKRKRKKENESEGQIDTAGLNETNKQQKTKNEFEIRQTNQQ